MARQLSKILIPLFLLGACKASRFKKEDDSDSQAASQPKRVQSADATPAAQVNFEVDEKTTRPRGALVLRLDYFPEPQAGVTNLPACYGSFGDDFELGVAYCDGKPEAKVPVTAKNVDQDCYTDSKQGRRAAVAPVSLVSCRRGVLLVHAFEPQLRIDYEIREVN